MSRIYPNNFRADAAIERKNDKVAMERAGRQAYETRTAASQDIAALRARIEPEVEKVLTSVRDENVPFGLKQEAAEYLYKAFTINNVSIRFDLDEGMNSSLVIKLIDRQSGKTVWQMPPERALEMKKLAKLFPGIMLDEII